MKAKWLFLSTAVFVLSGCAHGSSSSTPDFKIDPHYCKRLQAEMNNEHDTTQYGAKPTSITKARLLQQYKDYGCE